MRRLISVFVGGLALLLLSLILAGVAPAKLLNAGVLLVVLGPLVGAVIISCPTSLLRAARAVLANDPTVDDTSVRRVQQTAANLGQLSIVTALTGVLLASILFFANLGVAEQLQTLIATSALCLMYGLGFKLLVALPLETLAAQQRTLSAYGEKAAASIVSQAPVAPKGWRLLLGVALMLAAWSIGFMLLGGSLGQLIVPSKIILMLGLLLLLLWMSRGRRHLPQPNQFDIPVNRSGGALIAGVLSTVVGVMALQESLSTPDRLGPGLATASVGILYGLMAYAALFAIDLERET